MVEFAIVLPILLILSFGTLEMGFYLQRRLILGGASFVAARAAAVQGPKAEADAKQVLDTYAQDAQAPWIAQTAGSCKIDTPSPRLVRLTVTKQGDAWTGLLTGAVQTQGGKMPPIDRWTASAPISQEYVPGPSSDEARRPTDEMIDYQVTVPWQSIVPNFGGLSSVPGVAGIGGQDVILAMDPAAQAVDANPYDRHMNGSTSPSKLYVSSRYEDSGTTNAAMLDSGFPTLEAAVTAFYAAYAAPGNPAQQAMAAFVQGFAQIDRTVDFDKQADNVHKAEQAIFELK